MASYQKIIFLSALLFFSHSVLAEDCADLFAASPIPAELSRQERATIIETLKQRLRPGEYGVRLITDEATETPDPERPIKVTLPNGVEKYLIGLSGQNIILVDSISELTNGGIHKKQKIELLNKNGFPYGGEIDPKTGAPYGYAHDSSTWDVAVVPIKNPDGTARLKVLAGAMADGADGKPLRIAANNTRSRLIFDAEFRESSAGSGEYKLVAFNPKSILNQGMAIKDNWIERGRNGRTIFRHGYGGGPVLLPNGDLYLDELGRVPFVHEVVWSQRVVPYPAGTFGRRKLPYRTVIAVTYLDSTLSKVLKATQPILDVDDPSGNPWPATLRPEIGPLVEGGHIEIWSGGKLVNSMAEVRQLRAKGQAFDFQMLLSAGEYYSHYGSFMAHSANYLHSFSPVLNEDKSDLEDFTAPLKKLFTWLGRPVSFYDEAGQQFVMLHGVDQNNLSAQTPLYRRPTTKAQWDEHVRNIITFPVERYLKNGIPRLRIKDNTGLAERLGM